MEWVAYYKYDPFGNDRNDLQACIIAATVANASRDPKETPRPYEPADFMPKFAEEQKEQTLDEMIQFAEMFVIGTGGKDLRKKK